LLWESARVRAYDRSIMPALRAIVLSIDRLGASWLGPYGNTWLDTPGFNRLAAQSLLFETAIADSPDLATACRSWWTGRHAMQTDSQGPCLPFLAESRGPTALLSDDSRVVEHPLATVFGQRTLVPQPATGGNAHDVEDTRVF